MASRPSSDPFTEMFSAFGRDLHIPRLDVDAILDHHRRNFEALQKSAAAGASGVQAIAAKQQDVLQQQMQEIAAMARSIQPGGNPADAMGRQAEFVRKSFETAVQNAGEVARMMQDSGTQSMEILRQRMHESLAEIRAAYDKGR